MTPQELALFIREVVRSGVLPPPWVERAEDLLDRVEGWQ